MNDPCCFPFTDGFEDVVASLEALTVSDVDEVASGNISFMDTIFFGFTDPVQKLGIMHPTRYLQTRSQIFLRRPSSITRKLM